MPEERSSGRDDGNDAPLADESMVKCPDCLGSGQVVLLTSSGPCAACGGSGKVNIAPTAQVAERENEAAVVPAATEREPGEHQRYYEYDAKGRVILMAGFGANECRYTYYGDEES